MNEQLTEDAKAVELDIDGLEADAKESIWNNRKQQQQQRALLRQMVTAMELEPEF